MDLSEDQANALFPDNREQNGMEDVGDFHLGIDFGRSAHVVVYTESEEFELTEQEKEDMLDALDLDSIWQCLSAKFKILEHLRAYA